MNSILIVSTDKELAKNLKSALRGSSSQVVAECSTIKEATEAFSTAPNALVVLDLFIPGSSGMEALKRLKQMNENGMFLLLSRVRSRNTIERAFRLGALDVIVYPAKAEFIRDTILHRVARQQTLEDAEPQD